MDINRRQTDDIILDLHNERDSAFKSLLQTGDGSDVTLFVEGRVFHVHSFIIKAVMPECVINYILCLNIAFLNFSLGH